MPRKPQYCRVPVEKQAHDRLYEMSIRFKADAIPVEIAGLTERCGFDETPILKNAVTTSIRQVVPFIPDDKTLDDYAHIIERSCENGLKLINVRFETYDYIYIVESAERRTYRAEK